MYGKYCPEHTALAESIKVGKGNQAGLFIKVLTFEIPFGEGDGFA